MERPRIRRVAPGPDAAAIAEAASCLGRGLLVIVPTDTVYGVAAHARVPGAMDRLFAAKGRDRAKAIPLLASGVDAVLGWGARMGETERRLAERFWPGPLTLVLDAGEGTEGFRVPAHEVALALIRACGGVLRVTSANRSGEPEALTAEDAAAALAGHVTLALDAGPAPGGRASTVARVEGGAVRVLREGAVPRGVLEDACRIG